MRISGGGQPSLSSPTGFRANEKSPLKVKITLRNLLINIQKVLRIDVFPKPLKHQATLSRHSEQNVGGLYSDQYRVRSLSDDYCHDHRDRHSEQSVCGFNKDHDKVRRISYSTRFFAHCKDFLGMCKLFAQNDVAGVAECTSYGALSADNRKSAIAMEECTSYSALSANNLKCAFTLAEVLITLGIIGIVAAMTIPAIIQKNNEREYITKLKKFNSVMNQAFEMAKLDYGEIEYWGLSVAGMNPELTDEEIETENITKNKIFDIIAPYLKVVSRCRYGDSCETSLAYERYSLDGTRFGSFKPHLVIADGTTILGMTISSPSCKSIKGNSKALQNRCGEIFVDLNGSKPPNATGKDVFLFHITKYGIIPLGTAEESEFTFDNYCKMSQNGSLNGYGCAAWLIYNENMDYLHCNDLSWSGKKKCK